MDNYRKIHEINNQINKQFQDKHLEKQKEILLQLVTSRIRTSFIYSLAEFERSFGYLWGHEKLLRNEEITDNERRFLDLWLYARKLILDNGNNQIRNTELDIRKIL